MNWFCWFFIQNLHIVLPFTLSIISQIIFSDFRHEFLFQIILEFVFKKTTFEIPAEFEHRNQILSDAYKEFYFNNFFLEILLILMHYFYVILGSFKTKHTLKYWNYFHKFFRENRIKFYHKKCESEFTHKIILNKNFEWKSLKNNVRITNSSKFYSYNISRISLKIISYFFFSRNNF